MRIIRLILKRAIIDKYAGQLSSLEGSCDSQFNAIVSKIEAELKKTNGDMKLVTKIRSAYAKEKSAKKAAVMNSR